MILRALFFAFMAAILSLTSVTAAVAHMRAAGAVQIVLCGTPGVDEVITLDAFGEPMPTVHHCPECLMVTVGMAPDAPDAIRPMGRVLRVQSGLTYLAMVPLIVPPPAARGPPSVL